MARQRGDEGRHPRAPHGLGHPAAALDGLPRHHHRYTRAPGSEFVAIGVRHRHGADPRRVRALAEPRGRVLVGEGPPVDRRRDRGPCLLAHQPAGPAVLDRRVRGAAVLLGVGGKRLEADETKLVLVPIQIAGMPGRGVLHEGQALRRDRRPLRALVGLVGAVAWDARGRPGGAARGAGATGRAASPGGGDQWPSGAPGRHVPAPDGGQRRAPSRAPTPWRWPAPAARPRTGPARSSARPARAARGRGRTAPRRPAISRSSASRRSTRRAHVLRPLAAGAAVTPQVPVRAPLPDLRGGAGPRTRRSPIRATRRAAPRDPRVPRGDRCRRPG